MWIFIGTILCREERDVGSECIDLPTGGVGLTVAAGDSCEYCYQTDPEVCTVAELVRRVAWDSGKSYTDLRLYVPDVEERINSDSCLEKTLSEAGLDSQSAMHRLRLEGGTTMCHQFQKNEKVVSSIDIDALLSQHMHENDHLVLCIGAGRCLEDQEINDFDAPFAVVWFQVIVVPCFCPLILDPFCL